MAFFAPSRFRDFFSTICARLTAAKASIAAITVPFWTFIRVWSCYRLAGQSLGAASRHSTLFDCAFEGSFAEVRLGKGTPHLHFGDVRDVSRNNDRLVHLVCVAGGHPACRVTRRDARSPTGWKSVLQPGPHEI